MKIHVDKQGSHSHQLNSSQRENLNPQDTPKQIVKLGSGTNIKSIPQIQNNGTNNSKSTAAGEVHASDQNSVAHQKEGDKERSNGSLNGAQPIVNQQSGGGNQSADTRAKKASISGEKNNNGVSSVTANISTQNKNQNQGLPPTAQNPTKAKKIDPVAPPPSKASDTTTKNKEESENNKKVSPLVSQTPPPKTKNSLSDFNISAESFIINKKGAVTGSYKIGQILGEGAFGQVSRIIHKTTGIVRAMKTIKKSSIIKEEEERLFSEMNILKNLDHPNILRLIELFQDSKNYYLITEYCSGGELFDKIKSMTYFTEKMAADYMKQILSAVVYCHQNNIVHRDLKPENLLFDSDRKNANLKVIDFGTSRRMDKTKKMSKRLGTPYYIAPEVLDQNYDEKCDVWSCGVILYILLCGYPPFGGKSEDEILKKVRLGKFKFEPDDWGRISMEAQNLINKMLTYDPKKRISAEGALNDQWIQKNAPSNHISTRALTNLSSFYTRSKLKQAILTFIVSQVVSQQDKEELQKTFRSLDRNGDGTLSKEELIEGYTTVLGDKEKAAVQVEKILDEVDVNKSGKVDFTEFLMAASNKEILLSKAKVEQSFKLFDQDGNGNITKDELQYIMGDIPDEFWQQILEECDTNKDGMISQTEFIDLLLMKKMPL